MITTRQPPGRLAAFVPGAARVIGIALVVAGCARVTRDRPAPAGTIAYDLRFESSGTADPSALLGGSDPTSGITFATRIFGEITETTVREHPDALVAWRIARADVSLQAGGNARLAGGRTADVALALERPTLVRRVADGRVVAVQIDPRAGALASSVIRSVIAAAQFAVPPGWNGSPRSWRVEEDDLHGRYVARYDVDSIADRSSAAGDSLLRGSAHAGVRVATIRKTKLAYLAGDPDLPVPIPSGSLVGRYHPERRLLLGIDGTETTTILIAGQVLARTETRVALVLSRVGVPAPLELATLDEARVGGAPPIPLSWSEPDSVLRAALRRQTLGRATLASLLLELDRLQELARRELNAPSDVQLVRQLEALIYLQPDVADTLGGSLARAPAGSLTMHVIAGALAAAGRTEAQAALAAALAHRTDDPAAMSILIPLLGSARDPAPVAETALRAVAQHDVRPDVAYAARLALGTMARSLRDVDSTRSRAIVRDLAAAYGRVVESDEARRFLAILGNAGAPEAVAYAKQALADTVTALHVAAVAALRFVYGAPADSVLTGALLGAPDPTVRVEAARSLRLRPISPIVFEALGRALRGDEEERVRVAVLDLIWSTRSTFTQAHSLVQTAAAQDASSVVRERAQRLLSTPTDGLYD